MHIITHRGLDPSKKNYFAESSLEAFTDQLERGYGLEFDLQVTKDNKIIITHDSDLNRVSYGKDVRKIAELTQDEILSKEFGNCHLTSFRDLLKLIQDKQSPDSISAIHIKHHCQNKENFDIILGYLKDENVDNFILFDITPEGAKYLKSKNGNLHLAPSVSHPFDIKRYSTAVGGTLINAEQALNHVELFDWVWLDEWDLTNENNGSKKFYTKEIFDMFKSKGIKVALVAPELHALSPDLLGGESHQDALNKETLIQRTREIINLDPDAICTDYPDTLKQLIYEHETK